MMQFCLNDAHGRLVLKDELQQIARAESLGFTDRSVESDSEIQGMSYQSPNVKRSHPIINMSARRGDIGLSASNLGLGANQVVLSMGNGSIAAHAVAKRTLDRLERIWPMVRVPAGRRALPLKECPAKS